MKNTPKGCTAYNNQCVNSDCIYDGNRLHGSNMEDGTHTSNKNIPIYCKKCVCRDYWGKCPNQNH